MRRSKEEEEEEEGSAEVTLCSFFFGVWVMSTGWTILNGTLTD